MATRPESATSPDARLVTAGEGLVAFVSQDLGAWQPGSPMRTTIAGAELNVAVTVTALGGKADWIGVLGDDAAGALVTDRLRQSGVHGHLRRVERPTGLLVRERRSSAGSLVHYWRRESAGSILCAADVDAVSLDAATFVHLTGITPALSDSASMAVRTLVRRAHDAGAPVSFDVNFRSRLWDEATARDTLLPLLGDTTVFATEAESRLLLGPQDATAPTGTVEGLARAVLASSGAARVIVKQGRLGASLVEADRPVEHVAAPEAQAVDTVGAGDAFVGGYLAAVMGGSTRSSALVQAVAAGAWAVSTPSDAETPPTVADLACVTAVDGDVR